MNADAAAAAAAASLPLATTGLDSKPVLAGKGTGEDDLKV